MYGVKIVMSCLWHCSLPSFAENLYIFVSGSHLWESKEAVGKMLKSQKK
jgi:hypothetical protein